VHYLALLDIFCYGSYTTYKSTPNLPILNAAQKLKLQQLSLLSLAQNPTNLTYSNLMRELDITSTRDLENIVISAIYAGLLSGTLDPHHQRVSITSISPLRDVSPSSIPTLIKTLKEWSQRCHSTLSALESQITQIRNDAARRHKEEKEWNANVEKLIEKEGGAVGKDTQGVLVGKGGGKGSGSGSGVGRKGGEKRGFFGGGGGKGDGGDGGDGEMDIDEDEEEGDDKRDGGARSLKKRGLGGTNSGFGR
jgi:COP9 signalosome complex subunit 7